MYILLLYWNDSQATRHECKLLDCLVHFIHTERYVKRAGRGLVGFLDKPRVGARQRRGNRGVGVLRVRGDSHHVQAWILLPVGIEDAARLWMLGNRGGR